MTFATLRELHAIIGAAIDDIERVYRGADTTRHSGDDFPANTPPYTPPSTAGSPRVEDSPIRRSFSPPPARSQTVSPNPCDTEANTLPTPVSVHFPLPPLKRPADGRKGRERAQTLPPLAIPPALQSSTVVDCHRVHEQPLDFPSLDEPRYVSKIDEHEGKSKARRILEEDLFTQPEVISALNRIVSACGQLAANVQKPFLVLCDAAMGYNLPACLRFLESSHIVEILRESGPNGLHVQEIAKRITHTFNIGDDSKQIDPAKLSHILRLLATHHITREVRPDVFANNRISSFMDSGKELTFLAAEPENKYEGTNGIAAFVGLCTDEIFKASACLTDCYLPAPQPHVVDSFSHYPKDLPPTPSPPKLTGPTRVSQLSGVDTTPPSGMPSTPLRCSYQQSHKSTPSFASSLSSYPEIPGTPLQNRGSSAQDYEKPSTLQQHSPPGLNPVFVPSTPNRSQYTPPNASRLPRIPQSPVTPRQVHRNADDSGVEMSTPRSDGSDRQKYRSRQVEGNHGRHGSAGGSTTASLSPIQFMPNPGIQTRRPEGTQSNESSPEVTWGMGESPVQLVPPPTPKTPSSLSRRLLRRVGSKPLLLGTCSDVSDATVDGVGSAAPSPKSKAKSLLGAPFSYSIGSSSKSKHKERDDRERENTVSVVSWDVDPGREDELGSSWVLGRQADPGVGHVHESVPPDYVPASPLSLRSGQPSLHTLKSKSPSVASFRSPRAEPSMTSLRSPLRGQPSITSLKASPMSVQAGAKGLSARPSLASLRSPSSLSLRSPTFEQVPPLPSLPVPPLSPTTAHYAHLQPPMSPTFQKQQRPPSAGHGSQPPPSAGHGSQPPRIPVRSPLRESPSFLSLRSPNRKDSNTSISTNGSTTSLAKSFMTAASKPLPAPPPSDSLPAESSSSSDKAQAAGNSGPPAKSMQMVITPTHPMHAPFNLAFQTTKPYFEWLEQPENRGRLKRFGRAMTGTGGWEVSGAVLEAFPWQDLPTGSVVVDVGGGIGSTSMLLANAFVHLKFVVQDRPQVVDMGLAAWKARYPALLEEGRAAFQAHDFFTPQPPLPLQIVQSSITNHGEPEGSQPASASTSPTISSFGFDVVEPKPAVFLLRVIMHDWPDSYATRILLQLRKAAGPHTRLLLADYILPLACVDEDVDQNGAETGGRALPGTIKSLAPEGSPLLPNLGKANANAFWLDLTMRVMFNAQERTLRELTALALTAGWKIMQVTRAEGSLFGHVIAEPVDIPEESLALLNVPEDDQDPEAASTIYSPPMGDTFLTRVDLPSEDIIRSGRNLPKRKRIKASIGLGFNAMVASASENLGLKSRIKVTSPKSNPKRNRAYTVTGARAEISPPLPIPALPISTVGLKAVPVESLSRKPNEDVSYGGANLNGGLGIVPTPAGVSSVPISGTANGPGVPGQHASHAELGKKSGWKSLVKMLSKQQLSGDR
ncbi:hypothetical protein K474DRAFT_713866 [Panus rudis PR-1116 ss-1]|nr:hypothetical protein K474DRAFT_713866 [Panus rudis PR-1116 ss-1]